ncbi:MAG: YraN family protein [Cytophagales bacterium]|nr:YraN family protein [Cytophagales bacterium]
MSKNKELGLEGERFAANYLLKRGWKILETNYRSGRYEIDVIASKNGMLAFVEVKTRTNTSFGLPEEFVDRKKAANIMKGAERYIRKIDWKGNIRFDIISILKKEWMEIEHFEDAFY